MFEYSNLFYVNILFRSICIYACFIIFPTKYEEKIDNGIKSTIINKDRSFVSILIGKKSKINSNNFQ